MLKTLTRGTPLLAFALLSTYALSGCSGPPDEQAAATSEVSDSQTQQPASSGIDFFHGSFEDALALAEEESKKVFVDVYTTWCGPCIVMQETVFKEAEVGEYFNARFVNLKLDAESEDQDGPELSARYDIGVYPTYLILDSSGSELSRATSAMPGEQFIAMFSQMLGESEPTFATMKARYDAGERSQDFVQRFLMDAIVELSLRQRPEDDMELLMAHYEEFNQYKQIAQDYFELRPFDQLINSVDAQLVFYYKDKTARGDELIEFVLEHYEEFLKVSSDAAMSQLVLNATWYSALDAAQNGNANYTSYIEPLESGPLSRVADYERSRDPSSNLLPERLRDRLEALYLEAINDWDGLFDRYRKRFELSPDDTPAASYSSASRTLLASENDEHREYAVKWGRQAFEMDSSDPFIAANYMSALSAVGRAEEAAAIADSFREGMSNSEADMEKLELFSRITPVVGDTGAVSASTVEEEPP